MQAEAKAPTLSAGAALIGLLAFVLMGGVQALYGPSLPGLSRVYGVPVSTAGLVISAHGLGTLLGVLVSGALSAAPGAGRGLARYRTGVAVLLLAAGSGAVGMAPAWPVVLLGALVVGVGYGALTVGLNGLFALAYGARGAAMVNLLNALFGIGAMLSPLLLRGVGAQVGWPFLAVALGAGLLAPFAFTLDDRVPLQPTAPGTPTVGRGGLLVGFLVLLALAVGIEASSSGWNATYLVTLGASPATAASFASLFYLVFTLSRLAAVPLSLRVSASVLVLAALALVCGLLALAHLPALAPYALVALGGGVALLFPNIFTWLARAWPSAGGATALIIAGALLGGAVIPALVGQAVALFGERAIPSVILGFSALALGVGLWLRRRTGQQV